MAVEGCPNCGDQTLWRVFRNYAGDMIGWCRLCSYRWDYKPAWYVCLDPEGEWIRDQKREAAEARAEHWAEARAVEDHQERKHQEREANE